MAGIDQRRPECEQTDLEQRLICSLGECFESIGYDRSNRRVQAASEHDFVGLDLGGQHHAREPLFDRLPMQRISRTIRALGASCSARLPHAPITVRGGARCRPFPEGAL